MKLFSLLSKYWQGTSPKPPRLSHKVTTRDRALVILATTGEITIRDLVKTCNHGPKEIWRLRRDGYLFPLGSGERMETNSTTGCPYKVYKWTGKIPANWVKTEGYTGRERRKTVRGNK